MAIVNDVSYVPKVDFSYIHNWLENFLGKYDLIKLIELLETK